MIKLDKPVIVEGKYDKITLENIVDTTIITTDGFGIYNDTEKREYIKRLAINSGIIVITDSDYAGAQIRAYLKSFISEDKITNVYIPQIKGKEKRKEKAGKQGLLGLEGLSEDIILNALEKSKIQSKKTEDTKKVTKQDLYRLSLSGSENCSDKRKSLSVFLKIPQNLSSSAFLDAVNALYGFEEFENEVEKWQQEEDKK